MIPLLTIKIKKFRMKIGLPFDKTHWEFALGLSGNSYKDHYGVWVYLIVLAIQFVWCPYSFSPREPEER